MSETKERLCLECGNPIPPVVLPPRGPRGAPENVLRQKLGAQGRKLCGPACEGKRKTALQKRRRAHARARSVFAR